MRESPPPQLVALLERLGLATPGQVRRMGSRVRRLAQDLPRFESVWIDALAQARILWPFQAAQINAGRGESLRVGPYLLCQRLPWPEYVDCYRASRIDSGETVRLLVVDSAGQRTSEILGRLETLAAVSGRLQCEHLAAVTQVGSQGDRLWAAAPWVEGRTAAEWLVHNGRFPPEAVLEIARAMLVGLVALEKAGVCHGDLSAAGLLLTDAGGVLLLQPGIRAVFRPQEGYAHADLLPEAYDYLAPERITEGAPPNRASDVYACGCLWWHLLCGRPPLAGGDSLAKLRAAQAGRVSDVCRLAPEVPVPLAAAVSACLRHEPGGRPESMARLAATLGLPTRAGRVALARCLARPGRPVQRWSMPVRRERPILRLRWLAGVAVCLAIAAATVGGIWSVRLPVPAASIPGQRSAGEAARNEATMSPTRQPAENLPVADSSSPPSAVSGARPQGAASPGQSPTQPASQRAGDLLLPGGRSLEVQSLEVRAGQHVRGTPGKRPLLLVPRAGLIVAAEDVCFENVDFLWSHAAQTPQTDDAPRAIVRLRCGRAQFRGCSFHSDGTGSPPPVAIDWTDPADPRDSALSLPSGRLQLADCMLRRVGVGVDCRRVGAVAVELTNTLHLGSGPLLRLDHCPRPDEPVLIALSQVTLRGSGPLLECGSGRMEDQAGDVTIQAAGCAFVPRADVPLLLLDGPASPRRLLENMRWTGQGSLVSPAVVIAAWRRPEGGQQALDDAGVSIAGLVRSEVGFAGNSLSQPADSRIVRWQVPLQSADPPGIDPQALPPAADRRDVRP